MIEHINTTVDAIIDEMLQLETYLHGPNGTMRAQLQTVFKMIQHCSAQQLTYLLRTYPPHVTLHAARRIDASQQLQTPFLASWIAYRYSPLMTRLPCKQSSIASPFLFDWEVMASLTQKLRTRLPMQHPWSIVDLWMRSAVPTLGTSDLVAPSIRTRNALLTNSGLYPSLDTSPTIRPTEAHSQ